MSFRDHIRIVKSRVETYTSPLEKIQRFLSEADTGKATKSEQAIVVAYNMKKGMSEEEAYKIGKIPDAEWAKVDDSLKKDGEAIVASMPDVGGHLIHYGRGSADNYFAKNYKLRASDTTPKTDLYSNTGRTFSLKDAKGAVLLSPKGGEATGVVKSAIENFQKSEGGVIDSAIDDVVDFLKNTLDTLAMTGKFVEVAKSKNSFVDWYISQSGRKEELKRKSNKASDKDIENHMRAELSFYKIPKQDRNYQKKLINKNFMVTKNELDSKYFPDFVSSEFDISGAKINPKYAKSQDEKELYADNTRLKQQAIQILDIGIKQSEFHKKFASVFQNAGGLKKYIVYESASGHYKFTGTTGKKYTGSSLAVAKELMEFEVSGNRGATRIYSDMFGWATKNENLLNDFVLDFKASGKSGYTKFAIPTKKEKLIESIFKEEYKNIQEELNELLTNKIRLEEGILDVLKKGYRNVRDVITNITKKIKDLIVRFFKTVILKFTNMIRQVLKRNFNEGLDALGLDLIARVSF